MSEKQQLDIWISLQVSQVHPTIEIGGIPRIKTGRIHAISITDLQFVPFSDIIR
jgi:hypothetical protein